MESLDENDARSGKARERLRCLENNRRGLLPYDRRGSRFWNRQRGSVQAHGSAGEPELHGNHDADEAPADERSAKGANNLAKVLCRKENKDLINTIGRYTDGLVPAMQMERAAEVLSAAKAPKNDGKGDANADLINCHISLSDAIQTTFRKSFVG